MSADVIQKMSILLFVFSVYAVNPRSEVTLSNLSNRNSGLFAKVLPNPNWGIGLFVIIMEI